MDKKLLAENIQREILTALAISYPDPLTGRQYFSAFGEYSEAVMVDNVNALIRRGLVKKMAIRSCGDFYFLRLAELRLTFEQFLDV